MLVERDEFDLVFVEIVEETDRDGRGLPGSEEHAASGLAVLLCIGFETTQLMPAQILLEDNA